MQTVPGAGEAPATTAHWSIAKHNILSTVPQSLRIPFTYWEGDRYYYVNGRNSRTDDKRDEEDNK